MPSEVDSVKLLDFIELPKLLYTFKFIFIMLNYLAMPYYLITIETHGKTLEGIRSFLSADIDFAYSHFYAMAVNQMGQENIISFNCLMISSNSEKFRELYKLKPESKKRRYGKY